MSHFTGSNSSFPFMSLPPEVRDLCYGFSFHDHPIHVCDTKLHRSIGGPNRPKTRHLPNILRVSRQLQKECLPILARQCTLIFNDYFNFSHLVSIVPNDFAKLVRRVSLKGDIVPGSFLNKFLSLRHVSYQQLGNAFYPPLRENDFNKYATKAKQAELVELVMGRSPALNLLCDVLCDSGRVDGPVELVAEANVFSCYEMVSVVVDVNRREVVRRTLTAEHRFYDDVEEKC